MNSYINYIKNSLDNIAFLSLFISLISYWICVAFKSMKSWNIIGFYSIIASNTILTIILTLRWNESGYFPLSNLYESLLCFTWGSTIVILMLEIITSLPFLTATTIPLPLLTVSFATLVLPDNMQKSAPLVPALKSNWLMMHVSIMMLSYATLIIGSMLSIVFLFLSQENSQNKPTYLKKEANKLINTTLIVNNEEETMYLIQKNKLTILQSIDNLSYRTIGFGFPLLTIGIIAGAVWANEAWGSYWSWDPKETWALITWVVFAAYLHTRITNSSKGKSHAILASVGFVVVWICYLGVNFLGKGLHSYGWINS
nr:cytochrome c biogenesis protein [Cryptomonas sp. NIES-345]BDA98354.1 cytochrome c biogenesis protein [Cryptomonas sp. NIES-1327]